MIRKPVYVVGANGAPLQLQSGARAVAIRPGRKGDSTVLLLESGRLAVLEQQRINGVGIERFVQSAGFVPAPCGHPQGHRLTVLAAVREALALVEKESHKRSVALQKALGGQQVTYVPFDPEGAMEVTTVEPYRGVASLAIDLRSGICAGTVKVLPGAAAEGLRRADISLAAGWIVPAGEDPALVPRNRGYGGLVELAAFIVANSGLARLAGPMNLVQDNDGPEDAPFPRGQLGLSLPDGDRIVVGIDSGDELHVQYLRADDTLVCAQEGLETDREGRLAIGQTVGCIASVIVRARDLAEAGPRTGPRKAA